MASRRRVSSIGGAAVLLVVAAVIAIAVVPRGAADDRSMGIATTTRTEASPPGTADGSGSTDGAGSAGGSGGSLSPSNVLGAPVPANEHPASAHDADPRSASVEPWWRRVPPVAGTLTAPDGRSIGEVTVLAADGDTLTITIVGTGGLPEAATSAVLTSPRGGEEVLGTVSPDMRGVGFVLSAADADRLPDPIRVLELRGRGGAVVASAVLLPV